MFTSDKSVSEAYKYMKDRYSSERQQMVAIRERLLSYDAAKTPEEI